MDGLIDQPRLERALELIYEAAPILKCRFVARLFSAYWQVRNDRETNRRCLIVRTADIGQTLDDFMAEAIDPATDPLVQVRIFRGKTDTVCIKTSHAVMDGGGFKLLMLHLASLYRTLGTDPSYEIPPDVATDRSQGQVLRRIPFPGRVRALFTQPFHARTWAFPWSGMEPTGTTFSERTVDTPVAALKAAVRDRGVTLTDVITAAFARALFEAADIPDDLPLPFTLAVDLRRFLQTPDETGIINLTSLTWIELARRSGSTFDELPADTHAALDSALRDLPGVGLAMVMEITSLLGYGFFRLVNRLRVRLIRGRNREFPCLTNLGVMDPKAMDFGEVEVSRARFYSPVFYPPTFCIVSGSHDDRLYFTASYPRGVVPGDLVERFLDRMVSELESLR